MREKALEKLQEIVRDAMDDDTVVLSEDKTISDYAGWDSVIHMTILATLEYEYGKEFDLEEMTNIHTIKDLVDLIA